MERACIEITICFIRDWDSFILALFTLVLLIRRRVDTCKIGKVFKLFRSRPEIFDIKINHRHLSFEKFLGVLYHHAKLFKPQEKDSLIKLIVYCEIERLDVKIKLYDHVLFRQLIVCMIKGLADIHQLQVAFLIFFSFFCCLLFEFFYQLLNVLWKFLCSAAVLVLSALKLGLKASSDLLLNCLLLFLTCEPTESYLGAYGLLYLLFKLFQLLDSTFLVFNFLQCYLTNVDNFSLSHHILLNCEHILSQCLYSSFLRLFGLRFLDETVPFLIQLQILFCFVIGQPPAVEASKCSFCELVEKADDFQCLQDPNNLWLIDGECHGFSFWSRTWAISYYDIHL